jgi:hypothetical protein
MPELTRRRYREIHDCWHVYYGDVHVGTIAPRSGAPVDVDQWGWQCGFYPPSHNGRHAEDTAGTFEQRARAAWKYAMWDAGCKLPTQRPSGVARCFCGASIDIKGSSPHIYAAHMNVPDHA